MPTNAGHSVLRSTMWKNLIIFLLVSFFVPTIIGVVTQCYKCYDDIILEEDLDFNDTQKICTNTTLCVPDETTTTAATPVDPDKPNGRQLPPQNEFCIMYVTDQKSATGHIRVKSLGCSDDLFKLFTDVDADGCQTPAGLADINKFEQENETFGQFRTFKQYCSCAEDLCNKWQSKVPPGVPTPKPKTGGGAVSSLVFCFYFLSLLLSFLL